MTRGRLSCSILLPADLKKRGGFFLHVLLFPWHNESRLKTQFVCSLPHTCLLTISFLLQYFLQLLIPVTDRMLMQDWAYCSVVVRSCCGLSKYLCLLPRSGCGLICSSICQYYTFFGDIFLWGQDSTYWRVAQETVFAIFLIGSMDCSYFSSQFRYWKWVSLPKHTLEYVLYSPLKFLSFSTPSILQGAFDLEDFRNWGDL